jgi:RNA polymerase sigma-54 factor
MASLTLTQQQKLQTKLSPAQIQVMRMLELPACELQARINEELQENPALEEGLDKTQETTDYQEQDFNDEYQNPLQNPDFDYDIYVQDDDPVERIYNTPSQETAREDIPFSVGMSFGEYLKSQIYLVKKMDWSDRHIAKFVVGNIDENGYLRRTAEELVDDLSFQEGIVVTDEKMKSIIADIQQFDPPGVAAYDLQDCLLIQLRQKEPTASVVLAIKILTQHFDTFSRKQYSKILQRMEITEEQLKGAISEITRLNPRPGNHWLGTVYDRNQSVVIPDFFVEEEDDELIISLNQGDIPPLHISADYNQMLEDYSHEGKAHPANREAARFVKEKIDAAKWFIDAIRQRNETMMQTMSAIVAYQREFFLQGDSSYLKPMVLKDIADRIGHDVSTISRVCSNKYVQTQFGTFALKYFFSESITKQDGGEISTREIKDKVREVIANEDKTHPITDDELVEILHASGYAIARRTVAKYREQLGIPVARLRHQI